MQKERLLHAAARSVPEEEESQGVQEVAVDGLYFIYCASKVDGHAFISHPIAPAELVDENLVLSDVSDADDRTEGEFTAYLNSQYLKNQTGFLTNTIDLAEAPIFNDCLTAAIAKKNTNNHSPNHWFDPVTLQLSRLAVSIRQSEITRMQLINQAKVFTASGTQYENRTCDHCPATVTMLDYFKKNSPDERGAEMLLQLNCLADSIRRSEVTRAYIIRQTEAIASRQLEYKSISVGVFTRSNASSKTVYEATRLLHHTLKRRRDCYMP